MPLPHRLIASGVLGGGASKPFSPLDTIPLLWYDAMDISTLFQNNTKTTPVTADGQAVGAWADKSGNAKDATQAATEWKPLYKTGVINGYPAILGDGSNDVLATASIAHGIGTGNFYAASVVRPVAVGDYETIFSNGSYVPAVYVKSSTKYGYYLGAAKNFTTLPLVNTNYLFEIWRDSGTVKGAINGVQEATTVADAGDFTTNQIFRLFGDNGGGFGNIYIGELIFIGSYSASVQLQIQSYISGRWGFF